MYQYISKYMYMVFATVFMFITFSFWYILQS